MLAKPAVKRGFGKEVEAPASCGFRQSWSPLFRAQHASVLEQKRKWDGEYRRDPFFVFPGLAGALMRPATLTLYLRRLLRRVGIAGVQPCTAGATPLRRRSSIVPQAVQL